MNKFNRYFSFFKLGLVLFIVLSSESASASTKLCKEPHCDSNSTPTRFQRPTIISHRVVSNKTTAKLLPSVSSRHESLQANLTGSWESVTGWIGFPLEVDGTDFFTLTRGFPAQEISANRYASDAWDRQLFWIDVGDGIPRLLPTSLVDDQFEPDSDAVLTESGRLYLVQYVLYRQADVSYPIDQFAEQAALVDIVFVTDEHDNIIDTVIDVYDDDDNFVEVRRLELGDQLQIFTNAYDLDDPDTIYLTEYMEFKTLTSLPNIFKGYRSPNVDYTDQDIVDRNPTFDASLIPLQFLLEGSTSVGSPFFGYSEAVPLGFTWGEARPATDGNVTQSSGGGTFEFYLIAFLFGILGIRIARFRHL